MFSDDSKRDIMTFLEKKFEEIRDDLKDLKLPSDWPGGNVMRVMMDFAAGLFIWADMVINYIAQPAADDPLARLQIVLDDMKTQSGIEQCDQVDILYARIIFEAFQKSTRRNKAKSILAIVLLAKEPLRKSDVIELLSTAEWDSSIMTQITLGLLSPYHQRQASCSPQDGLGLSVVA